MSFLPSLANGETAIFGYVKKRKKERTKKERRRRRCYSIVLLHIYQVVVREPAI
jgi:hypothetical protein